MIEVVIGTSDDADEQTACGDDVTALSSSSSLREGHEQVQQRHTSAHASPAIAVVREHVTQLAALLQLPLDADTQQPLLPCRVHAHTPPADEAVCMLDQLFYWAVEEGNDYNDSNTGSAQCDEHNAHDATSSTVRVPSVRASVLAQTHAPALVYACVTSGCAPLVAAAVPVLERMLRHPHTATVLLRCAANASDATTTRSVGGGNDGDRDVTCATMRDEAALVTTLSRLLCVHGGLVDVVVATLASATTLLRRVCDACAADDDIDIDNNVNDNDADTAVWRRLVEPLLRGTLVSSVLCVMQRYGNADEDVAVSVAAVEFLAALVDVPRSSSSSQDKDKDEDVHAATPVAVLLCQLGGVHTFVLRAARTRRGVCHTALLRAVVHFVRVTAAHAVNVPCLLRDGVHAMVQRALRQLAHTPDAFVEAAEAVSCFVPWLDRYQQRELLCLLRRLLTMHDEVVVLTAVLAVLHVCFAQLQRDVQHDVDMDRRCRDEAAAAVVADAVVTQQQKQQQQQQQQREAKTVRRVCVPSGVVRHPRAEANVQLVYDVYLPQLVQHVIDYHVTHAATTTEVTQLCRVADACLRVLPPPPARLPCTLPAQSC